MNKFEKDLISDITLMAKIIHKMDITISVLVQNLHDQNLVDGIELKKEIEELYESETNALMRSILNKYEIDDEHFVYPHFGPIGEA